MNRTSEECPITPENRVFVDMAREVAEKVGLRKYMIEHGIEPGERERVYLWLGRAREEGDSTCRKILTSYAFSKAEEGDAPELPDFVGKALAATGPHKAIR